jgi:2-polyprenyl-3-methyl-5-hydroxy-6-metoxy-1,4-benzoquinol methylase
MKDKNTLIIIKEVSEYIFNNFDLGKKIVDLGCGNCYILDNIHKHGYENILGADIKNISSDKSYPLVEINLSENNWSEIILQNFGEFDIAIATEVIEHLTNPFLFLSNVSKILQKDGILILTFPNVHNLKSKILYLFFDRFSKFFGRNFSSNLHPIYDQHIFIPNLHLVTYFLSLNGFKIKEIRYITGFNKLFGETTFLVAMRHN